MIEYYPMIFVTYYAETGTYYHVFAEPVYYHTTYAVWRPE